MLKAVTTLVNLIVNLKISQNELATYSSDLYYYEGTTTDSVTDLSPAINRAYNQVRSEIRSLCRDTDWRCTFEEVLADVMPCWTLADIS